MVGRLQGFVDGRPFLLDSVGEAVNLNLPFASLRPLLGLVRSVSLPGGREQASMPRLNLKIGRLPAIPVRLNSFPWNLVLGQGRKRA
jgi:hypothetical protein